MSKIICCLIMCTITLTSCSYNSLRNYYPEVKEISISKSTLNPLDWERSYNSLAAIKNMKSKPLAGKLLRVLEKVELLEENDDPNITNKALWWLEDGSSTAFRKALKGKISADKVVCRNLIPYLLEEVGSLYGYQALTMRPKSSNLQPGHIVYITRISLSSSPRWVIISWNSFLVAVSSPEETLEVFVDRVYSSDYKYSVVQWKNTQKAMETAHASNSPSITTKNNLE